MPPPLLYTLLCLFISCGFLYAEENIEEKAEEAATETEAKGAYEPPSDAEIEVLLDKRLEGKMHYNQKQFANMFVVISAMQLGRSVGLITDDPDIAERKLMTVYPSTYKPTFREFLDMMALQIEAKWEVDKSGEHITNNTSKTSNTPIFKFTKHNPDKTFDLDIPDGWSYRNRGCWMQFIPPKGFTPLGMDIYNVGSYSFDSDFEENMKAIREAQAMEWAKKVKPNTTVDDMSIVTLDGQEALFFETQLTPPNQPPINWRQWVVNNENRCYFIISTLAIDVDDQLYPDVKHMLDSLQLLNSN